MTSALTSLTSTYTDSEGEEHHDEEDEIETLETPLPPQKNGKTDDTPKPRMNLVSYGDEEAALTDDEDKHNTSNTGSSVVWMPARPTTPKIEPIGPSTPESIEDITEEPKIEELPIFNDVEMPPEPKGSCTFELQQKIYDLTDKMQGRNVDMNTIIQQRKAFRNPSIYEKLIQFCNINEFGTNYEPHIYDPLKYGKDSYYDELAKLQKQDIDQKDKERKDKVAKRLQQVQVEFVVGTRRNANGTAQEEEVKKRRSKWDQVATSAKPPTTGMANLTTSVTGTKGTIISAFGSLPKKPKI